MMARAYRRSWRVSGRVTAGLLALVLAACTGGNGADDAASEEGPPVVDADDAHDDRFAAALAANLAGAPGSPITSAQAECVAPAMIDAFGGADAIADAGFEPDDLAAADPAALATNGLAADSADARSLGEIALDCGVDLAGAVADTMGDDLAASARTCLSDQFDAEVVGRLLVLDDTEAIVVDAALACAHHLD